MNHYSSPQSDIGQDFSGIIPFQKRLGETLSIATKRFRAEQGIPPEVKLTYAGRLDPAAEGLLLFLVGGDRHKKDEYLGLDKEYELTVLFGVKTDTGDLLGIPTNIEVQAEAKNLSELATVFQGKQKLPYPLYSSRPVNGKPLFMYARSGEPVVVPEKVVTIHEIELLKEETVSQKEIIERIHFLTTVVEGDFRQIVIKEAWDKKSEKMGKSFQLATFRIKSSSGAYMRSLAEKMGEYLGVPACAYAIVRRKIGDFSIID